MSSSSLTIKSNLASGPVLRLLEQNTAKLQESFSRLSSGLRINQASDDPAGLALAEGLDVDRRVFAQGVRNINDAVSLLSIQEGALCELSQVLTRQQELAQQAANGTLSHAQRLALHQEANALAQEYNRIIGAAKFNDITLFDALRDTLDIQSGYGTNGTISFALASSIAHAAGTGSFGGETRLNTGQQVSSTTAVDLNGDNALDLLVTAQADSRLEIYLNNGDGTFRAGDVINGLPGVSHAAVDDINGDDIVDIVTVDAGDGGASVVLGKADGSFAAPVRYEAGVLDAWAVQLEDLNEDGSKDILIDGEDNLRVMLNRGDGTFLPGTVVNTGTSEYGGFDAADLDGDGHVDAVVPNKAAGTMSVLFGCGDGTFEAPVVHNAGGGYIGSVSISDLDGDGYRDIVATDNGGGRAVIFMNNSGRTFNMTAQINSGFDLGETQAADITDDGVADLVSIADTSIVVHQGSGDGTFLQGSSIAAGWNNHNGFLIADLNVDGAPDVTLGGWTNNQVALMFAETELTTAMPELHLAFADDARAAMEMLDAFRERVGLQLGAIGAMQSRFSSAAQSFDHLGENLAAAQSRIIDADVADEAAQLVKHRILQQAGAEILAQANQAPALALTLLQAD